MIVPEASSELVVDDTVLYGTIHVHVVVGGSGGNTITDTSGPDILIGRGVDEVLSGGDGADPQMGQDGNDTLTGGAGRDVFVGGPGTTTSTDFAVGTDDTK